MREFERSQPGARAAALQPRALLKCIPACEVASAQIPASSTEPSLNSWIAFFAWSNDRRERP